MRNSHGVGISSLVASVGNFKMTANFATKKEREEGKRGGRKDEGKGEGKERGREVEREGEGRKEKKI